MRYYLNYQLMVVILIGFGFGISPLASQYIIEISNNNKDIVPLLDGIKNAFAIITTLLIFNKYVVIKDLKKSKAILVLIVSEAVYTVVNMIFTFMVLKQIDDYRFVLQLITASTIMSISFKNLVSELHRQFQDFFIPSIRYKTILMKIRRKTNIINPVIGTVVGFLTYFITVSFKITPLEFMYIYLTIKFIFVIGFFINLNQLYKWYKEVSLGK